MSRPISRCRPRRASQLLTDYRDNDAYAFPTAPNVDYAYAANGLNQYTGDGSHAYCYDANGNLTADGGYVYLYDVENRLVEMRVQGSGNTNCSALLYTGTLEASLRYDPAGRLNVEADLRVYSQSKNTFGKSVKHG